MGFLNECLIVIEDGDLITKYFHVSCRHGNVSSILQVAS